MQPTFHTITDDDLDEATEWLASGEVVAIPTETVYGLAANATDAAAVAKIFEVKNRPLFDPLIVHIGSLHYLHRYAKNISPKALKLAENFWPGPLTLVFEKTDAIPYIVTSGLETVGIRIPQHPLTLSLLGQISFPLAAPSANPFGYISPTTAQHVHHQLGGLIPMILDGGPCKVGLESTIVQCTGEAVKVLRLGGLSVEMIENCVGKVDIQTMSTSAPQAPGQMLSHYAPRKPLLVGDVERLLAEHSEKKCGVLTFTKKFDTGTQRVLSEYGSISEAAQNLFSMMRELDACDVDVILAEWLPETGLGRAINDRLQRASAQ